MSDINWDNHIQTAVETAMEYDKRKLEYLKYIDTLEDMPSGVVVDIKTSFKNGGVDINIVNKWVWDDDEIH